MSGYVFQVPKEIKDGAISYQDMMIAVTGGDYTEYEKATGVELAYSNFYQIEGNDSTSVSLYCPTSSLDLSTLDNSNEKASFDKLMDELAFELYPATEEEEATYFGIDTETEFYQNMEFGEWQDITEKGFEGQRYMSPINTSFSEAVSMEPAEDPEEEPQVSVQQVDVSGYITMITPKGKPTRMLMVYSRNENAAGIPMEKIAESLRYEPENKGAEKAFDAEEVRSIEEASMQAALDAMEAELNSED